MKKEHTYRNYQYISKLADHINDFINMKRSQSFSHCNVEAYRMKQFDRFLIESELDIGKITINIIEIYIHSMKSRGLKPSTILSSICTINKFSSYLRNLGIESFIWHGTSPNIGKRIYRLPYIPSQQELKIFANYVDQKLLSIPLERRHFFLCLAVIIRLFALCGLRNSEAADMLREEVRFSDNTLYIRHSKGDKDRIVPFNKDIGVLLRRCDKFLEERFPNRQYFFVNFSGKHISRNNIAKWFREQWQKCFGKKNNNQRPTVHDLRHMFVVRCVDQWGGENGADFSIKFPLLSKYLGHKSVHGTLYYYHLFLGYGQIAENWIMSCNKVAKEVSYAILK